MPQNVKLDKNGVDNTFVKLSNGNNNDDIVYKTPINSLIYKRSTNLNLSPDDVSMYDLNTHKFSGRPDTGDLANRFKTGISNSSYGSAVGKITIKSSSILDPFSKNIGLPYRDTPTPTVYSNKPFKLESVNRSSVDFYNNYSAPDYKPHGAALENRYETSAVANKTLVRRVSEAKNTYFNSNSYKNIRYNTGVIAPTYEKKSKFEDCQFSGNNEPQIMYTMKNFDRK